MRNLYQKSFSLLILIFLFLIKSGYSQESNLGIFEAQGDIGKVGKSGSVKFDPEKGTYTVTGGGTNMWFTGDEFHFIWEKVAGDISIAANITWPDTMGNPHKKFVKALIQIQRMLMLRSMELDLLLCSTGKKREMLQEKFNQILILPPDLRLRKKGIMFLCL